MTDTEALQATARIALACLDLTSLNDSETPADIERLCERATGRFGATAAVCVWPRRAALARSLLPPKVAVAAVANFPDGGSEIERAVRDTGVIADAGAQEVDVVLPYRDLAGAPTLLAAVRRACAGLTLKVILETGELKDEAAIRIACRIALDAGADFLKTSTGKHPVSATPAAARLLLAAIAGDPQARGRVGFKPAGGIRTVADLGKKPLEFLEREFGKFGSYLYEIARGIDERPVTPWRERQSYGCEETFPRDIPEKEPLLEFLRECAKRVFLELGQEGKQARTVTLKIKYFDFQTVTRRQTFDHLLTSPADIFLAVKELLEHTEAGLRPVRLAGISLSNFSLPRSEEEEAEALLFKEVKSKK